MCVMWLVGDGEICSGVGYDVGLAVGDVIVFNCDVASIAHIYAATVLFAVDVVVADDDVFVKVGVVGVFCIDYNRYTGSSALRSGAESTPKNHIIGDFHVFGVSAFVPPRFSTNMYGCA